MLHSPPQRGGEGQHPAASVTVSASVLDARPQVETFRVRAGGRCQDSRTRIRQNPPGAAFPIA